MKDSEKEEIKETVRKEERFVVKKYAIEFKDFLKEYAIVGMAIAFIMGGATKELVQSLVNDIVMPFINPIIPGGNWAEASFEIGSIVIKWGPFLSALLNFIILALVVFFIAKKILKEAKVKKK